MTATSDQERVKQLRARLELDDIEGNLEGLDLNNLDKALEHPKAAESIATLLKNDASSVKAGEMAPDFSLPRLAQPERPKVSLSHFRGQQPVALAFGSYT